MRLSYDPKDPGHAALLALQAKGERPVIHLNGERLNAFVTADDLTGEVTRLSGMPEIVIDPATNTLKWVGLNPEITRGRVRIAIVHPPINPNALCAGVPAA